MVPMEVGKGDYDRLLSQGRIPHDITSEVPYSRPRVDDANIDGVIGGYKHATRTPTVLVELSSAHRNRSSTSVNDDLDVIAGRRDQLEGKLQERYGYAKDRAQKEMDDWYGRQTW